ncbi:MAG: F510_1955 family glycosylhydrolase [Actinomycetes bacterium]
MGPSRQHTRPSLPGGGVLRLRAVGVALAALALLAGCAEPATEPSSPAPQAPLGHVHGLGTDPGSGTLYVASHLGVFTLTDDGTVSRVADRWQDTMAFTVVGAGHLLASGHPDLREDLPVHLGLIESRDGARTWRPLAMTGEADFHALAAEGDRVWAYDAVSGRLLTSSDRERWTPVAAGTPVVDLTTAETPDSVLATTPAGEVLRYDATGGPAEQVDGSPPVVLLDRAEDGSLVGVTADGVLHVARPDATGWRRAGEVPGSPHAFDASDAGWHVATAEGVYRSTDEGRTWQRVIVAVSG